MHGRGGMCGGGVCIGGRAWQERRPLQRAVRILLEYILVMIVDEIFDQTSRTYKEQRQDRRETEAADRGIG